MTNYAERERTRLRALGRGTFLGLKLLAVAAIAAGCGAQGAADGNEAVDSNGAALHYAGWRVWQQTSHTNPNGFADSPGICPFIVSREYQGNGFMIFGRDKDTERFVVSILDKQKPWLEWTTVEASPRFNSRPSCAALDELHTAPSANWNNQIALVGRRESSSSSANNRYYIQIMLLETSQYNVDYPQASPPAPPPSVVAEWAQLDSAQYAGSPGSTVVGGHLVVAGRRSDNRIYVHVNPLDTASSTAPYDASKWESAVKLAALPVGWTAIGNPNVAQINGTPGECMLTIRAKDSTDFTKVHTYYMNIPKRKQAGYKLDQGTWRTVDVGYVGVGSDVALEFDPRGASNMKTTAYFRATHNAIMQASTDGTNWEAFTKLDGWGNPIDDYTDFESAPVALGNANVEGGHVVVARRADDQFYWAGMFPGAAY